MGMNTNRKLNCKLLNRYRHCDPLHVVCPSCGDSYQFCGLSHIIESTRDASLDANQTHTSQELVSKSESTLLPEDYLQCPKCRVTADSKKLSSAMLANQVNKNKLLPSFVWIKT